MNENKKYSINNMLLAFITFLGVVGLVALTGFFLLTPPDDIIMGQAEATQVRISGKVPGRIEAYRFSEGDKVKVGDTLVFLDTPEVLAKLQQAEAVRRAAEAQNAKAIKGARAQEIAGAYEMWQKAKAGLDIAQKSYTRVQNLFDKGVMSAQKRDEAEASYKAMAATEKAAKSQYDMAVDGARVEDKAAAAALVGQAAGAVAEVESYLKEAALVSAVRIVVIGFMFGNLFSILYSLAGAALSLTVMTLMKKKSGFSILGISVAGGVSHNIGQLIIASLITMTSGLIYYAPALLISGVITGLLIGTLTSEVLKRIRF